MRRTLDVPLSAATSTPAGWPGDGAPGGSWRSVLPPGVSGLFDSVAPDGRFAVAAVHRVAVAGPRQLPAAGTPLAATLERPRPAAPGAARPFAAVAGGRV